MRTERWTLALLLACVALVVLLWWLRAWVWLGVPPVNEARDPFSDGVIHLATAVNCAQGNGEWHGRVCFVPNIDAVPRAQTYEPWLSLHRLGVDQLHHAHGIIVGMIGLFLFAIAASFRPQSAREALLVFALLSSSAVQLGIERANYDLLIATLLCLAGALLARNAIAAGLLGVASLALATMLKLYTGLACLLAWLVARAPMRWLLPASMLGLAVAVAVVGPAELIVLGQGAPEGATRHSTGARWLFLQAGWPWGVAAMVIAAATTAWTWRALSHALTPRFDRWPRRLAVFQLAVLTAVPLFVLKDSYDYRLVLWLPALALPLALLREPDLPHAWRRLAVGLIALFAFVAWTELPARALDQLAANTGNAWPASLAHGLSLAKQFAAWMLAALLGLVFLIATWQRWQPVLRTDPQRQPTTG